MLKTVSVCLKAEYPLESFAGWVECLVSGSPALNQTDCRATRYEYISTRQFSGKNFDTFSIKIALGPKRFVSSENAGRRVETP